MTQGKARDRVCQKRVVESVERKKIFVMAGNYPRCGACKFFRRKCAKDCPFAPYFCHEEGEAQFTTIHKVFSSKNFIRFFSQLSPSDHKRAIMSFLYEAQARLDYPTLGCVREILHLQRQVELLQAQVAYLQSLQATQNNTNDNIILSTCTTSAVANVENQDHITSTQPQPSVPSTSSIPPEGSVGIEGHMDFDEQQIDELYEKLMGSSSR